jgi:hypothetical protein
MPRRWLRRRNGKAWKAPKEIDITIMAQPDGQPLAILCGIYALGVGCWQLALAAAIIELVRSNP